MKKNKRRKLKSLTSNKRLRLGLFAVVFGLIGVGVLVLTQAATNNYFIEPETSTVSIGATVLTDTTASGGSAVKFAMATPGSCSGAKHTAGGDDGMGGCWPGLESTGVPNGTNLTTYTGSMTISTANTIIDGKLINGCPMVTAAGVIIRNSRIVCTNGFYALDAPASRTPWLLLEDMEIFCGNSNATAVGEEGVTARRVMIHGCENGFDVNKDMLIEDSFIFNLYNGGEAHADGIQMPSSPTGLNLTVRHNTIIGKDESGNNGTSAIIDSKQGDPSWPVSNFLIERNLLSGGAYTLYCPDDAWKRSGLTITNNVFVFGSPAFSYSTNCNGTNWSSNTLSNGTVLNP